MYIISWLLFLTHSTVSLCFGKRQRMVALASESVETGSPHSYNGGDGHVTNSSTGNEPPSVELPPLEQREATKALWWQLVFSSFHAIPAYSYHRPTPSLLPPPPLSQRSTYTRRISNYSSAQTKNFSSLFSCLRLRAPFLFLRLLVLRQ